VMVFIAKYWAPDRTVAELKQWQLPNSEFINIQGMQAHVSQSANCRINRGNTAEKNQPETIVLLHGTSASLHTWEGWTKALSD
ncbi:alpha/beta fold hydrolase, partial [Paraburkholderia sp. SIMBA_030]|uniref:alpha/beta fold hydrolase n=1 Tax=Paraburkholderia sp. SIMBA_030 TaxID=3085773 RepID=UPI00397D2639